MSKIACAGNTDPGKSLVRLPRILLYCSRRVTVAFVYAPRWSSTQWCTTSVTRFILRVVYGHTQSQL
jgi:hypothetical protein